MSVHVEDGSEFNENEEAIEVQRLNGQQVAPTNKERIRTFSHFKRRRAEKIFHKVICSFHG
jgi:hypothetical protein